jgi:hypothetical protein
MAIRTLMGASQEWGEAFAPSEGAFVDPGASWRKNKL